MQTVLAKKSQDAFTSTKYDVFNMKVQKNMPQSRTEGDGTWRHGSYAICKPHLLSTVYRVTIFGVQDTAEYAPLLVTLLLNLRFFCFLSRIPFYFDFTFHTPIIGVLMNGKWETMILFNGRSKPLKRLKKSSIRYGYLNPSSDNLVKTNLSSLIIVYAVARRNLSQKKVCGVNAHWRVDGAKRRPMMRRK